MSGLLRRLTRRPATADENRSSTESSDPTATAATAGGEQPLPGGGDQPTQVIGAGTSDPATREWAIGPTGWSGGKEQEATATAAAPTAGPSPTVPIAGQFPERRPDATEVERSHARDLPAGVDPAELEHAPASARRGRLRRRLRYLRAVREILLRDLGGLTYEIHRRASGSREASHDPLVRGKAERIAALDAEVRALETGLGEPHAAGTLRVAGVGGTCPSCGELHASDAHFCSRCGAPLDARAQARHETTGDESGPASALWAGLRGRKRAEPTPEPPERATGEWLGTGDQPTTFDRATQPDTGADAADERPGEPVAGRDESGPADGEARAADGDHATREGEAVTSVEGRREQP